MNNTMYYTCFILLFISCNDNNKHRLNPEFGNHNPLVYEKDTKELIDYCISIEDTNHFTRGFPSKFFSVAHMYPRILNVWDNEMYDKLMASDRKTFNLDGLSWYHTYNIVTSEILVLAKVVEFNSIKDTSNCRKFKGEYKIVVSQVFHDYTNTTKFGDTLIIKDYIGENGGCNKDFPESITDLSHHNPPKIGDENLIPLSHYHYFTTLVRNQILRDKKGGCEFDDEYDNTALMYHPSFRLFNINKDPSILEKVRHFFSHNNFKKS